jgi:hypothetical protein
MSLKALGNLVAEHFRKEGYTHDLLRVGMSVTVDPTPFLLAEGRLPIKSPETGGPLAIDRIGTLTAADGGTVLDRLYLPGDDESFLQIAIDQGLVSECRYFAQIDEILPASPEEWRFWIDPAAGLIGQPAFPSPVEQTQYLRAWARGAGHVSGIAFDETIRTIDTKGTPGSETRTHFAMLYGLDTGLSAPAPTEKWILVSHIRDGDEEWIAVHGGVTLNPSTLGIA